MSDEALTYDEVVAILDERDSALVEKFAEVVKSCIEDEATEETPGPVFGTKDLAPQAAE